MKDWRPVDFVIGVFTITVSVILISIILDAVVTNTTMNDEGAEGYTAVLGSLIAIISMYVGATIQNNRNK